MGFGCLSTCRGLQVLFESALKEVKARNITAVKPFLNFDDIDIEDGKVKGLDKQIKKLIEGDDTKFLFDTPPKPNDGKPNSGIQGNDGKPNNADDVGNSTSINHGLSVGARMAQAYNKLSMTAQYQTLMAQIADIKAKAICQHWSRCTASNQL